MSDKIINTFQQRRQLALAIAELAQTQDERGLIAAAQDIYDAYPEPMIQAEILKNLDTPDSQLRGGLGHLAALLPRENVSPALRSIAADRSQPSQSRLTAAMLLAQFVGDPMPQALLSDISQPNEVALQSLREAVEEGKKNRHILLEYVLQMRQAGDHVAPMILDLLEQLPVGDRIELLRLIALDDREFVSVDALGRLEQLASTVEGTDALRALHVLQFLLPASLTGLAERAVRKLRFSGNVYHPPDPTGWRALMSVADLSGRQAVWFVRMPHEEETGTDTTGAIIYLTLDNHTGQIHALGDENMHIDELPPEHPIGQIVPVETDTGRQISFLETPFDFARWRLMEALPKQWETESELPPEFRLYSDLIWQFARPAVTPDLQHYFQDKTDGNLRLPASVQSQDPDAVATELLRHTAMQVWLNHNRSMFASSPEMPIPDSDEQRAALAQAILAQLERSPESEQIPAAMADGLRAQAAWFAIAGNPDTAELILALAESVPHIRISRNPLLLAIIESELRARLPDTGDG